jgi:hypothetical protein
VFAQDVLKSRASHGLASSGQEHFRAARLASQGKPGAERHPDFLPEQQGALLAAFAVDADLEQSPVESNVILGRFRNHSSAASPPAWLSSSTKPIVASRLVAALERCTRLA